MHFGRHIRGHSDILLSAIRSQNQKPSPDRSAALSSSSQGTAPAKGLAQRTTIMRETYLLFARWTAISPSCCGPSRFLSLLLDFSSRQRQPAGLPGGRSGLRLLLVGPVKCRPGQNNENGPEYKAIPGGNNAACRLRRWNHTRAGPCPDRAQMPTASRKYYWAGLREHVGISQIIKRRSDATHIFVKKKGSDPRCPL
jgi:hypothetical protein